MAIIILLVSFVAVFLNISAALLSAVSKKESFIISILAFCLVLVGITEILSAFTLLNFTYILFAWCAVFYVNGYYLYKNGPRVIYFAKVIGQSSRKAITGFNGYEKFLLIFTTVILMLAFLQGLLYPPNNWDSMTYHMARIASWVSHQGLAHYATHIIRQLYQPPFAEYVIMHFDVLNGSDLFSNSVQFFFLLFTIIVILLICESFGLSRKLKLLAVILAITIPEVILQAASTQNDLVVAFFIVTAYYFAIKTITQCKLIYFLALGAAIGLGLLTKGTAYLYFAPVLLLWGIRVLVILFKTKNLSYLGFAVVAMVLAIGINAGHYYRNYKLTNNPLGVDKKESKNYANHKMGAGILASSVIKNAGLHTGFMFVGAAANLSDKVVYKLHAIAGIDINSPDLNYNHTIYTAKNNTSDEDSAPNPIHFILIIAALIIISFSLKKINFEVKVLLLIILLQFIFFCFYLKWQPWNSRLHTPLFLSAIPLLIYAVSINGRFKKAVYFISPVLLVYAFMIVLHNNKRPYSDLITEGRYLKYFVAKPANYISYNAISNNVKQLKLKNIGLIVREDDWVYPLFSDCFSRPINPVYIQVNNLSKGLLNTQPVDCIVSTTTNAPYIDYNGRRFYRRNSEGKAINFYR